MGKQGVESSVSALFVLTSWNGRLTYFVRDGCTQKPARRSSEREDLCANLGCWVSRWAGPTSTVSESRIPPSILTHRLTVILPDGATSKGDNLMLPAPVPRAPSPQNHRSVWELSLRTILWHDCLGKAPCGLLGG